LEAGIDEVLFRRHDTDGSAQAAFQKDLAYTHSLSVRGLPARLIRCGKQSALASGMIEFSGFAAVIERILEQDEKA
jgi:predicted DsbA family dithiol-disulfide isomerase